MKVWVALKTRIREGIGPGFPDTEVPDGFDVRSEPFPGAEECEVKKAPNKNLPDPWRVWY